MSMRAVLSGMLCTSLALGPALTPMALADQSAVVIHSGGLEALVVDQKDAGLRRALGDAPEDVAHRRKALAAIATQSMEFREHLVEYGQTVFKLHFQRAGAALYGAMPAPPQSHITGLRERARFDIERIAEVVGVGVDIVSTGPDRTETIILRDPFGQA